MNGSRYGQRRSVGASEGQLGRGQPGRPFTPVALLIQSFYHVSRNLSLADRHSLMVRLWSDLGAGGEGGSRQGPGGCSSRPGAPTEGRSTPKTGKRIADGGSTTMHRADLRLMGRSFHHPPPGPSPSGVVVEGRP